MTKFLVNFQLRKGNKILKCKVKQEIIKSSNNQFEKVFGKVFGYKMFLL